MTGDPQCKGIIRLRSLNDHYRHRHGRKMLTLVICLAGGIILGLRFRGFVLIPAVACVILVVGIVGIAREQHLSSIIWSVFAAATALQIGYLFAVFCSPAIV